MLLYWYCTVKHVAPSQRCTYAINRIFGIHPSRALTASPLPNLPTWRRRFVLTEDLSWFCSYVTELILRYFYRPSTLPPIVSQKRPKISFMQPAIVLTSTGLRQTVRIVCILKIMWCNFCVSHVQTYKHKNRNIDYHGVNTLIALACLISIICSKLKDHFMGSRGISWELDLNRSRKPGVMPQNSSNQAYNLW